MKKKLLTTLLAMLIAICLVFSITACDLGTKSGTEHGGTEQGSDTEQGNDTEQSGNTEQGSHSDNGEVGDLTPTEGLEYTLSSDGTYYIVSGIGTATDTDIVIASSYNGLPVKEIKGGTKDYDFNDSAFGCRDTLTSIVIPDSITTIGDGAFAGCTSLTSITIPDSVTSIGEWVFVYCISLTSVTIGNGVTYIGEYAFYLCYSLTSVTIGNGVTYIGDYAFAYCYSLTNITIPDSVTYVGDGAFRYCYKLIEVYNLSNLEITAGSYSNGYVGYYAKSVYTSLNSKSKLSVTDDGFIVYADDDAGEYYLMGYTGKETDLTLPDSINGHSYEIYQYAFYVYSSLISVTIPDSVTSIGDYAFIYCYKLIEVYNLSNLEITAGSSDYGFVGYYAKEVYISLNSKSKLSVTDDGFIVYADDDADEYYLMGYTGTKTDITLPNSINGHDYEIYQYAFYLSFSLKSITIPDNVTSIGDYAFYGCYTFANVTIGNGITYIGEWVFAYCTSLASVNIPDSVTYIDYGAFYGCTALTSVTIGNGVISIGGWAFEGCTSLTSVTIGNSVTYIDEYAFAYCYSLTNITIPDSVTSIGSYAFDDCYKLIEVYNLSNLEITAGSSDYGYVGYYAKDVYTSLNSKSKLSVTDDGFIVYADDDADEYYLMGYTGKETDLTLPDSINGHSYEIYQWAFTMRFAFTSVSIPNSVTSIGERAFAYCISLTSITIPDSVTNIDEEAFMYCFSLTSVTIGNSVTSIGYRAFSNCSSLTSITIPDSVTSIGSYAFAYCSSLTSISIPDSVTSIGSYAFYWCASLTSVTIGNGVTSIGDSAFYRCTSLTSVTFENTEGWSADGISISSSDLADPATAAEYLTDTYCRYYWYRR